MNKALLALVVLLSGCGAIDKKYTRPSSEVDIQTRELHDRCKMIGEMLFNLERHGPYTVYHVLQCPDGSLYVMPGVQ